MWKQNRNWTARFKDAGRGIAAMLRGQPSFAVHLGMTVAVVCLGVMLQVNQTEWCLLILCIAGVLSAETLNTAIEGLAAVITQEHHDGIGRSLDIAAGAVLLMSVGSAAVGLIILLPKLLVFVSSFLS